MILYTHSITSRLTYIVEFIQKEIKVDSIHLTTLRGEFEAHHGPKINYSDERISETEIWIRPCELLFEREIKQWHIECFELNGNKAFFKTEGDIPFDILAASFYLLSRYEEYLPHKKDAYGRYGFENSLAFKNKFLHLPLINIWLRDLKYAIDKKYPVSHADSRLLTPDSRLLTPDSRLQTPDSRLLTPDSRLPTPDSRLQTPDSRLLFLPTYDIDIAWSYKHKGWWRNLGGGLRSLIRGDWPVLKERINVLRGKKPDPFDAFSWMDRLHEKYKLSPYYFFLVPGRRGRYDKNISPSRKPMQELIRDHLKKYQIGIHPSWKSGDDPSLLKQEIAILTAAAGKPVVSSRQHYIRFNLPGGYRRLIENGIKYDFSMGYGSINGFRASVCSPFFWYDLEKEQQTDLIVLPFCFMEANAFYEQKLSAKQALDEMRQFYRRVQSVNGSFIMIWHNSFLGTDRSFDGWREVYEQFIAEVVWEAK